MAHHDDDTVVLDPMVDALDEGSNGTEPAELAGGPAPEPGLSVLAGLKARHDALAAEQTLDLPVPGTDGKLALRLGLLPRKKIALMQQQVTRPGAPPETVLNANMDTLITGCQTVLVRQSRDEEFAAPDDDSPIRIGDQRLAAIFGLGETARAREICWAMFRGVRAPDLAIGGLAGQYMEWLTESQDDVDAEFAGES